MAELEFTISYASPEDLPVSGIRDMLKAGVPVYGLYLLCVEPEGKHMLEIMEGVELTKSFYKARRYRVIGVADGKAAAFELLRRMISDYLAAGRELDGLRDYLRGLH